MSTKPQLPLAKPAAKLSYESLALAVDQLYPPYYALKDGETVEQHCEDIASFIENCGWQVEEFMDEYINRGITDGLPSSQRSN